MLFVFVAGTRGGKQHHKTREVLNMLACHGVLQKKEKVTIFIVRKVYFA